MPHGVSLGCRLMVRELALCWLPVAHADTVGPPVGIDQRHPADRARWQRTNVGRAIARPFVVTAG
jgi:hypothetical protein